MNTFDQYRETFLSKCGYGLCYRGEGWFKRGSIGDIVKSNNRDILGDPYSLSVKRTNRAEGQHITKDEDGSQVGTTFDQLLHGPVSAFISPIPENEVLCRQLDSNLGQRFLKADSRSALPINLNDQQPGINKSRQVGE
jgi:hypothetical protein